MLTRVPSPPRCFFAPIGLLALAVGLAGLCGCSQKPVDRAADPRPNVILITLDTVRADHLSCYGYERSTSPRIDEFAAGATRYEYAMATAPWTVPTHASLFTGKAPFEHGAHSFKVESPRENNVSPLPPGQTTLAEALRDEGYSTGGFVANVAYLSPWTQLNRGFQTWQVEWGYADRVNASVRPWLERNRNQPFFLFINYMDAHRPYNTSPRPGFLDPPAVQDQGRLLDKLIDAALPGDAPAPPELVRQVIDQYDTAIANLDEQVGVLLDWLRELGLFDNSMIVITSDHGEYFGEHNLVEHSKDIYQPAIRVPLIVKPPVQRNTEAQRHREEGGEVDAPGASLDGAPKSGVVDDRIVSLALAPHLVMEQMPAAIRARHGATFAGAAGDSPVLAENYYSRTKDLFDPRWGHRFNRVRTAIYEGPYKYIESSDGQHELYNLEADPGELHNLFEADAERAAALAERIRSFQASRERPPPGRVDTAVLTPAQRRVMAQLGYITDEDDDGE